MSTQQRNDVCVVVVDREVGEVVRSQTVVVLEANHYYFEEIEAFGPDAQYALSVIYRDAFAVLDAIGWDPAAHRDGDEVAIPLTPGHVKQLRKRRFELGHRNIDRLEHDESREDIDRDRAKAQALDRVLGAWKKAVAAGADGG
jgi:hypothetical protein